MLKDNNRLFDQLEDEEEIILDEGDSSIPKFKNNFDNLDYDIINIEAKAQNIQGHITVLESKIQMIDAYLKQNQNNPNVDLGKSFLAFNKTYELLSFMQKSYESYSELKFKYRVEQNDLKFKLFRMDEIEKKKINEIDELNNSDIMSAINKFMSAPDKKENVLMELNNNPKYNL